MVPKAPARQDDGVARILIAVLACALIVALALLTSPALDESGTLRKVPGPPREPTYPAEPVGS